LRNVLYARSTEFLKKMTMSPNILSVLPRQFAQAGYEFLPTPLNNASERAGECFIEFFTAKSSNTWTPASTPEVSGRRRKFPLSEGG
jgi:hypothetical protein